METDNIKPDHWEDQQINIEQADIAPLMASLIGINFPINSVVSWIVRSSVCKIVCDFFLCTVKGKLPLDFLKNDLAWKSHAALGNARQLRESFQALYTHQQQRSLSWRFRNFQPLSPGLGLTDIEQINTSIRASLYEQSVSLLGKIACSQPSATRTQDRLDLVNPK